MLGFHFIEIRYSDSKSIEFAQKGKYVAIVGVDSIFVFLFKC